MLEGLGFRVLGGLGFKGVRWFRKFMGFRV